MIPFGIARFYNEKFQQFRTIGRKILNKPRSRDIHHVQMRRFLKIAIITLEKNLITITKMKWKWRFARIPVPLLPPCHKNIIQTFIQSGHLKWEARKQLMVFLLVCQCGENFTNK